MSMAKVMPDLKALGQEQFFLLWASLYPLHPWMNPLAPETAVPLLQDLGICHVEAGIPSPLVSLCFLPITSAFGKGCGMEGFCFSVLWAPPCHSHTAHLFFLLIKVVQSSVWVHYFPSPRVAGSQMIWTPSNHMMKRSVNLNKTKTKKKNYTIGFLIQSPMTQQKLQFGLERGGKCRAL